MKKVCEHILNLKIQKIANLFVKCPMKCTGNKTHYGKDLDICLSCGESRCQNNQTTTCSYQHSYGTKHPLVYRMSQQCVFCFTCQQNLTKTLTLPLEQIKNSNKIENISQLHERIMEMAQKLKQKKEIMTLMEPTIKNKKKELKKQVQNKKSEKNQSDEEQKQINQKNIINQNKSVKLIIFGLKNLGNTCFFNSIIQCLYSTQLLHSLYSTLQFDTNRDFGKVGQINIIFNKYLKNSDKYFTPKALFNWVCKCKGIYKHMDQQDAQQVLGLLLNGLIDGEKYWIGQQIAKNLCKKKKNTITQQIFGFYLASRLFCLQCEKISWSIDFSLEVAVQLAKPLSKKIIELPSGNIQSEQIGQQGLVYPSNKQSNSMVDHFFAPEIFTKHNYFQCQKCGSQKAFRKFYMKDPPKILIVCLKRFNNNGSKNNASVKFPFRLELDGHVLNPGQHIYQLFAMTVHSGTARGGHYVAYTRRDQDWFYFSDDTIKIQSWEKVKTCQPYILFYKRV